MEEIERKETGAEKEVKLTRKEWSTILEGLRAEIQTLEEAGGSREYVDEVHSLLEKVSKQLGRTDTYEHRED